MRTAIHVRCDNQVLSYVEMPFIASGDVNEDEIEFEFDPMWEGFTKTAVFYRTEADVFHVLLEEDDTCIIPHEVLADPGPLYFGVFGTRGDRVRTSEIIQYTIKQGAITEATKVSDPTPDIYSQILAACEEATRIANEALNKPGNGSGGVTDHADLTGRDTPDQHPISAIANLQLILDHCRKSDEAISAGEISYTHENLYDKTGTVKAALDEAIGFVTGDLTNTLTNLATNSHSHNNKGVLDKFGENESGEPIYNGKSIGESEKPYTTISGITSAYFLSSQTVNGGVSLFLYEPIYENHTIKNLWFIIDGTRIDVRNLSALDGKPYCLNMDKLINSPATGMLHVVTLNDLGTESDFISSLASYTDYEFELEIYL